MTNNSFKIDGALAVQNAPQVLSDLRRWIDGGDTALDIDGVAPVTGLPGQVALQVLLAAEREIVQRGAKPELSPAARLLADMAASRTGPTPLDGNRS